MAQEGFKLLGVFACGSKVHSERRAVHEFQYDTLAERWYFDPTPMQRPMTRVAVPR